MRDIVVVLIVLAAALALPLAIGRMRHWLRNSRSGGFVGSLGAGIAAQVDPGAAMLAAELEKEEGRQGEKADEGP
jgi:hypothetical protein